MLLALQVRPGPLVTGQPTVVSDDTRRDAGLSIAELWLRYFELGGMGSPRELESYLRLGAADSDHEHNIVAQALNERFSELGRNHPVSYAEIR